MSEPKWPQREDVKNVGLNEALYRAAYNRGIDECIAAYRLANDDPSKSPVGEVRRDPDVDGAIAIRFDASDWAYICGNEGWGWRGCPEVKGWPVIGAVPGTPAAEAKS